MSNKSNTDFHFIKFKVNNGKTAVATQFSMINRVTLLIQMITNLKINRKFILTIKSGSEIIDQAGEPEHIFNFVWPQQAQQLTTTSKHTRQSITMLQQASTIYK